LKRFSAKDHLHLIKLLVTFSWREQYYLLFPWADGNLLDFWKLYPKPSDLPREYRLTLWLAEQCLGIAEGLKMIHTLDKPDAEDLDHGSALQIHGRHGDLKPENILWFKPYQNGDQNCFMGVLKISDFGLTRFHRTMSKSHINAETVGVTGTYRAPEYDVAKLVSQSYDIWTLGCVILEFVTWYLVGWEQVDKFSENRTKEHQSEFKEDVFFNFVNIKDDYGRTQIGARAKRSVADVSLWAPF
jgi:serine/threonine protein kinase